MEYRGRQTTTSSREYSGKGKAMYGNGETYEGDFKDGVRTLLT
jgi:hypothetical protein